MNHAHPRSRATFAAVLLIMLPMMGCAYTYRVGMGPKTPARLGKVSVYSTDNVPFEYEELEFVSVLCESGPGACFAPPSQEFVLDCFAREVDRTGADAVLSFRMDAVYFSDWIFFPGGYSTRASGVAVKIKRP